MTAGNGKALGALWLILPGLTLICAGFAAPLALLARQSLDVFVPGRIGAVEGMGLTGENYRQLLTPAFLGLVWQTLWLGIATATVATAIAMPMAWAIVRRLSPRLRSLMLGLTFALVFLSVLVKIYAISMTFGAVGPFRPVLLALGINPNGRGYIEFVVAAGLVHAALPVAVLSLVGAVQNLDPRLLDAAGCLGAPRWRAHLDITLPMVRPALVSAWLIALTYAISAFVIPLVLGRGRVNFVSNMIYTRFSEIANYPSGAAISVVMLALSLITILLVARAAR